MKNYTIEYDPMMDDSNRALADILLEHGQREGHKIKIGMRELFQYVSPDNIIWALHALSYSIRKDADPAFKGLPMPSEYEQVQSVLDWYMNKVDTRAAASRANIDARWAHVRSEASETCRNAVSYIRERIQEWMNEHPDDYVPVSFASTRDFLISLGALAQSTEGTIRAAEEIENKIMMDVEKIEDFWITEKLKADAKEAGAKIIRLIDDAPTED